jgi:hypothetical protein
MIAATLLALQVVSSQPDANALNYEPKMLSADCAEWTESRKENGAKRVNDVAWAQSYVDRWKRAASPGFTLAKFVEVIDRGCERSPELGLWGNIYSEFSWLAPERD